MKLPFYRMAPVNGDAAGCIEMWRDARRDLHDVIPLSSDFSNAYFQTSSYRVDSIVFSKTRMRNLVLQRRERHLHDDESRFLRVRLFETGGAINLSDGSPTLTKRGQISVLDYSRPSDMVTNDMLQIGVYVPHAAIGYDPRKHPTDICFEADTPSARILANAIRSYYAELDKLEIDDAAPVASSFIGMLAGLVDGGAMSHDERCVQSARLDTMCAFLRRRLKDPGLSIEDLEKSFGASRATIFRDFAGHGGVAKYIQTQRLERAYAELATAAPRRGLITSVSERWGFASATHFNRLFRKQYGSSPGNTVGMHARTTVIPKAGQRVHQGTVGIEGEPEKLQSCLAPS